MIRYFDDFDMETQSEWGTPVTLVANFEVDLSENYISMGVVRASYEHGIYHYISGSFEEAIFREELMAAFKKYYAKCNWEVA